jgi:hypothetical protein
MEGATKSGLLCADQVLRDAPAIKSRLAAKKEAVAQR